MDSAAACVAGFPNMFFMVHPNTGLGHNSIVFMIEAQAHSILGAVKFRRRLRSRTVDLKSSEQARSYTEVQQRMGKTVWASGCKTWYLHDNGTNDTLWPGYTFEYWWRTRRFDPARYQIT